jgi:hypothetical protein
MRLFDPSLANLKTHSCFLRDRLRIANTIGTDVTIWPLLENPEETTHDQWA